MFDIYREVLGVQGIFNGIFTMILMAMCEYDMDYRTALEQVAEYQGREAQPLHSYVCYWLLSGGIEEYAAEWFAKRVKEVEARRARGEG